MNGPQTDTQLFPRTAVGGDVENGEGGEGWGDGSADNAQRRCGVRLQQQDK